MLSGWQIGLIGAADVIDVRHEVLRPGRPRETAIFAGDDAASTFHIGAFASGGAGHIGAFASGGAGHIGAFASGGAGHIGAFASGGAGHIGAFASGGAGHIGAFASGGAGHIGDFASGGAGHIGAFASGGAGHIGAFASGGAGPVGVVTMLENASERHPNRVGSWQLRGMAVLESLRGRGLGGALVDAALREAATRDATLVWCNARRAAVNLYLRSGFGIFGPEFEIEGIGPHSYMERELSPTAPFAH